MNRPRSKTLPKTAPSGEINNLSKTARSSAGSNVPSALLRDDRRRATASAHISLDINEDFASRRLMNSQSRDLVRGIYSRARKHYRTSSQFDPKLTMTNAISAIAEGASEQVRGKTVINILWNEAGLTRQRKQKAMEDAEAAQRAAEAAASVREAGEDSDPQLVDSPEIDLGTRLANRFNCFKKYTKDTSSETQKLMQEILMVKQNVEIQLEKLRHVVEEHVISLAGKKQELERQASDANGQIQKLELMIEELRQTLRKDACGSLGSEKSGTGIFNPIAETESGSSVGQIGRRNMSSPVEHTSRSSSPITAPRIESSLDRERVVAKVNCLTSFLKTSELELCDQPLRCLHEAFKDISALHDRTSLQPWEFLRQIPRWLQTQQVSKLIESRPAKYGEAGETYSGSDSNAVKTPSTPRRRTWYPGLHLWSEDHKRVQQVCIPEPDQEGNTSNQPLLRVRTMTLFPTPSSSRALSPCSPNAPSRKSISIPLSPWSPLTPSQRSPSQHKCFGMDVQAKPSQPESHQASEVGNEASCSSDDKGDEFGDSNKPEEEMQQYMKSSTQGSCLQNEAGPNLDDKCDQQCILDELEAVRLVAKQRSHGIQAGSNASSSLDENCDEQSVLDEIAEENKLAEDMHLVPKQLPRRTWLRRKPASPALTPGGWPALESPCLKAHQWASTRLIAGHELQLPSLPPGIIEGDAESGLGRLEAVLSERQSLADGKPSAVCWKRPILPEPPPDWAAKPSCPFGGPAVIRTSRATPSAVLQREPEAPVTPRLFHRWKHTKITDTHATEGKEFRMVKTPRDWKTVGWRRNLIIVDDTPVLGARNRASNMTIPGN